jgi:2-polyprenyl-6-hydroxyphenyl methylase/3-demethylubiquinone-9 3-methyltransferase
MMRWFIDWQIAASKKFDRLLPEQYRIDGKRTFEKCIAPRFIFKGMNICDVGAGKRPYITTEMKDSLGLNVVGLDISQRELELAPKGAYTRVVCADISSYTGNHEMDLVICQAVLEHVPDVECALRGISSILKPGGIALIFLPCRNALFARLNALLPEKLKRKLLFTIFPSSRAMCGFPSFYDQCTPRGIVRLATRHQLVLREMHAYFCSPYFSFFLPFHLLWRGWSFFSRAVVGDEAAESFTVVLQRR